MIDVLEYPSPQTTGTTVVYAVGDIHGRLDLLQAMDRLIADDIAGTPPERPTVCYHEDRTGDEQTRQIVGAPTASVSATPSALTVFVSCLTTCVPARHVDPALSLLLTF